MKSIDLESHFSTELWKEAMRDNSGYPRFDPEKGIGYSKSSWLPVGTMGASAGLADLAEGRIAAMDAAGVDCAVLSLTAPGVERFDPVLGTRLAVDANNVLADAISRYPDRLGGFATLAPNDTDAAVRELERCVKELGFLGWNTHSNFGKSYIDEKRYWPLLAKVEELKVPIYLHPTTLNVPALSTFGIVLSGPNLGFGVDTLFAFMRMIVRGVFDAFPDLKVILGHYGEGLPFLLDRVDCAHRNNHSKPNKNIGPGSRERTSYYLKRNMWVTTSGNYLPAAFQCTRDSLGMNRILLGTDYPYEDMGQSIAFLRDLGLSPTEESMLFEENARAIGF